VRSRVLTVTMVFAVLVAATGWCGGGGEQTKAAQGPVKINYWTLFTGGDKEYMDAMVDRFLSEVKDVQVEPLVAKWENYYDFLSTAIAGGNAPDCAIIHMTYVPVLASKGALVSLDSEIKKAGINGSDFLDVPWQRTFYQGKQYAVPLDVHPIIYFYNKKVYRKAGLLDAAGNFQPPSSPDGWMKVFETVKTKTNAYPYNTAANSTGIYREWFGLLYQFGGTLLTADNKKAAFNGPAGVQALQLLQDFIFKYKYAPENLTNAQTLTMFKNDEAGGEAYGVWRTGVYEADSKVEFGATFFPTFGKTPAFWANSHVLALPQQKTLDPQKVAASMKLINWLTDHTIMWTKAGHVPSKKSVINGKEYQSLPNRPFAADISMLANVKYAPAVTSLDEVERYVIEAVQAAVIAKKDPKQALDAAAQKVNSVL
jgi:multiple sugar transport system substrate-binding protein